MVNQFANYF